MDDCDSTVELLEGRPLDESDEDGDGHVECELDVDVSVWEGQEGLLVDQTVMTHKQTVTQARQLMPCPLSVCLITTVMAMETQIHQRVLMWVRIAMMTTQHDFQSAPELCNGTYDNCEDFLLYPDGIPEKRFDDDGDGFVECEGRSFDWFGQVDIIGEGDCDDTDELPFQVQQN